MDISDSHEALALPARQSWLDLIENIATSIPSSAEPSSANPKSRAAEIVRVAGLKAGALSATLVGSPGTELEFAL